MADIYFDTSKYLDFEERKNCKFNKTIQNQNDKIYDILMNGDVVGTLFSPHALKENNINLDKWIMLILTISWKYPEQFDYGLEIEYAKETLKETKQFVLDFLDNLINEVDDDFYGSHYNIDFETRENIDHDDIMMISNVLRDM